MRFNAISNNRKWMSILVIAISIGFGWKLARAAAPMTLATVNGKAVTTKDIDLTLSHLNATQKKQILGDPNAKRKLVDNLIDQEVLIQEAERLKVDEDPEFKESMAIFRRQFLVNKVLEKTLKAQVTDANAKKFYEQHKLRYSTDQVRAQHILLTDEKTAQDILKKAKEPNADFLALAEKFSKDPSAKTNRGELGFFPRDRMVSEFTDAAFAANPGQVTGPIRTDFGYHIIKVIEKKPGKALNYEEVEAKVKDDLRQDLVKALAQKLRSQAKVQVDQSSLNKL